MQYLINWATPILLQATIVWALLCVLLLPSIHLLTRTHPHLFNQGKDAAVHPGKGWIRTLLLSAAYLAGVIAFTFLPLPNPETFICQDNTLYYTRYFAGWSPGFALRLTEGMGPERFIAWPFLQIYLNVLLFVPWGLLARRIFKASFRTTLLSAFFTSLFIELTQLTGLWGIYDCRYRTFDVDDILTNTLGAILGFLTVLALEKHRAHKTQP